MVEKNNKTTLIIIIAVLASILSLVVGVIVGREMSSKEEPKTTEKEETNNNEKPYKNEISEELKNEIMAKINAYNKDLGRYLTADGIDTETYEDEIRYFLHNNTNVEGRDIVCSDIELAAKNYFDTYITCGDIKYDGITIFKLQKDGTYKLNAAIGPGDLAMKSFYVGAEYDKENDVYTIYTKDLFNQYCSSTCGYGMGMYHIDPKTEIEIYDAGYGEDVTFDSVYEKIKDQVPVSIYKFKKNSNGNYVFDGVTRSFLK